MHGLNTKIKQISENVTSPPEENHLAFSDCMKFPNGSYSAVQIYMLL